VSKSIRCKKCSSTIAKEEGNKIILRSGFGKAQTFNIFSKDGAVITCWHCKEVNTIGEKNA